MAVALEFDVQDQHILPYTMPLVTSPNHEKCRRRIPPHDSGLGAVPAPTSPGRARSRGRGMLPAARQSDPLARRAHVRRGSGGGALRAARDAARGGLVRSRRVRRDRHNRTTVHS